MRVDVFEHCVMWVCNAMSLYIYMEIHLEIQDAPARRLQDIIHYIHLRKHILKVTKQTAVINCPLFF